MGHGPVQSRGRLEGGAGPCQQQPSRATEGSCWAEAEVTQARALERSTRGAGPLVRSTGEAAAAAAAGEAGDAGGRCRQQASQEVRDEVPAYSSGWTSAQVAAGGRCRGGSKKSGRQGTWRGGEGMEQRRARRRGGLAQAGGEVADNGDGRRRIASDGVTPVRAARGGARATGTAADGSLMEKENETEM